jgi:hypothetical protein
LKSRVTHVGDWGPGLVDRGYLNPGGDIFLMEKYTENQLFILFTIKFCYLFKKVGHIIWKTERAYIPLHCKTK